MGKERTPEVLEADRAIEEAINKRLALVGDYNGEILMDWMIMYSAVPLNGNGGETYYGVFYRDGYLPMHVALGLVQIAKNWIETPDDDD